MLLLIEAGGGERSGASPALAYAVMGCRLLLRRVCVECSTLLLLQSSVLSSGVVWRSVLLLVMVLLMRVGPRALGVAAGGAEGSRPVAVAAYGS